MNDIKTAFLNKIYSSLKKSVLNPMLLCDAICWEHFAVTLDPFGRRVHPAVDFQ